MIDGVTCEVLVYPASVQWSMVSRNDDNEVYIYELMCTVCHVCTIINYNVIIQIIVVFIAFLVASCVPILAHDMARYPF